MTRVGGLLLVLALSACGGASAAPSDEPRRYADYEGTSPTPDQCALPVEQRTGGWLCPQG